MDSSTRRRRRGARAVIASLGAALVLSGCGFNAQTLQQYTPAHGVNVDVRAGDSNQYLKVRNLLVASNADGEGILSASIVSPQGDELVSVEGMALKADNTVGSPLEFSDVSVELTPNQMAVLTGPDAEPITVSGADLTPGLTADLTLTFASGLVARAVAPVTSFEDPIYATVSPTPTPTPSVASPAPETTPAMPAPEASPTTTP